MAPTSAEAESETEKRDPESEEEEAPEEEYEIERVIDVSDNMFGKVRTRIERVEGWHGLIYAYFCREKATL